MSIGILLAIAVVVLGLITLSAGIKVVKQSECIIIESLGSYTKTLNNGLNFLIPFIDRPREIFWIDAGGVFLTERIDLRESVVDIPQQAVITRDNVTIDIDALLYIQIMDPVKATYEISNLPIAVSQLAQTSLRNVIGEMDLDGTLGSRDVINSKLKVILDEATDKWGTKVNRVELKNISPPEDIQNAMEKQMQAERERRAQVLTAEGDKQAKIHRSEGEKQEQINISEGDRVSRVNKAKGESEAIALVAGAKKKAIEEIKSAIGDPELATQFLVATNYLEEFGKFAQKEGDKVFIPYESSTSLGALGSIQELLKR